MYTDIIRFEDPQSDNYIEIFGRFINRDYLYKNDYVIYFDSRADKLYFYPNLLSPSFVEVENLPNSFIVYVPYIKEKLMKLLPNTEIINIFGEYCLVEKKVNIKNAKF